MSMTINTSGGGAGLNFRVVGNVFQPSPKENLIWVNTGTPVAGYSFSRFPSSTPVNGDIWFRTAQNSSPVEFNALKKNVAMIYPQSCFQYEDGSWVEKAAKTWMNGAWKNWYTYYYYLGNQETNLTGGWITKNGSSGVVTFEDGYVSLGYSGSGVRSANIYTNSKVDVRGKQYLKFELEKTLDVANYVYCGLTTNNTASDGANNLIAGFKDNVTSQLPVNQKTIISYDISATSDTLADNYYIRVGVGTNAVNVYRVWVE